MSVSYTGFKGRAIAWASYIKHVSVSSVRTLARLPSMRPPLQYLSRNNEEPIVFPLDAPRGSPVEHLNEVKKKEK